MTLEKEGIVPNSKEKFVQSIFSTVSKKYDCMNDLMSLGIHRIWKRKFIDKIPEYNIKLLDVAGGTGDIAYNFYKKALKHNAKPEITILDLNPEMLREGKKNLIDKNILNKFNFICANAQRLPFDDNSFDYYTISYGIRNVDDILQVLKEARRVLKPGGKFLCLEFSKVKNELFSKFYNIYSEHLIPLIGEKVTGSRESYEYLVDSIREFPSQQKFCQLIEEAGFKGVEFENLSGGISAIHWGYKL